MIVRRWSGPLAVGLAVVGLVVFVLAIATWVGQSEAWAYDFHAYYDAALRISSTGSPYLAETLDGPFRLAPPFRLPPFVLYMYSPVLALLFVPLTQLGGAAVFVWLLLHISALAVTCALMPITRVMRVALFGVALLSVPVLRDMGVGNVSLLVTLCAVLVWRWLDRPAGAIALAASLTVRPAMALIAGWWLLRGLWRPVLWTALAGVALVLVSFIWLKPGIWLEYVTVLRNVRDLTGVPSNADLGSAVLSLGGPAWLAQPALYSGYAVAIVAMLLSLRRDRELSYVVTLMATVLLTPLMWDHYLTNLLVPAAFLIARGKPWGLVLLPLGSLPQPLLPLVAMAGMLLPFVAPDRGKPASELIAGIRGHRLSGREVPVTQ